MSRHFNNILMLNYFLDFFFKLLSEDEFQNNATLYKKVQLQMSPSHILIKIHINTIIIYHARKFQLLKMNDD